MFFSTVANLLSSIPTFLFPVFASYKALKTSDPALLTPWLMYWVVLACALFVESWTGFILTWIPFYAWFRLGFLLYLILPQTQGARVLYQSHVHPFLRENEKAIEDFITTIHDRAKTAGVTYLQQAIELIKQNVLGFPPKAAPPPPPPSTFSYTQSLIARFNLPSARPESASGPTNTANDFYSLLASAVNAATSSSTSQTRDLSNSGSLIPPTVYGEERLSFIAAQRERLTILLSALDKEANTLQGQSARSNPIGKVPSMFFDGGSGSDESSGAASGLTTRKSEADFEKIDAESGTEDTSGARRQVHRGQSSSGSWMPWSWGARPDETNADTVMSDASTSGNAGKSSGVDV